jgi:hypothetical protein
VLLGTPRLDLETGTNPRNSNIFLRDNRTTGRFTADTTKMKISLNFGLSHCSEMSVCTNEFFLLNAPCGLKNLQICPFLNFENKLEKIWDFK